MSTEFSSILNKRLWKKLHNNDWQEDLETFIQTKSMECRQYDGEDLFLAHTLIDAGIMDSKLSTVQQIAAASEQWTFLNRKTRNQWIRFAEQDQSSINEDSDSEENQPKRKRRKVDFNSNNNNNDISDDEEPRFDCRLFPDDTAQRCTKFTGKKPTSSLPAERHKERRLSGPELIYHPSYHFIIPHSHSADLSNPSEGQSLSQKFSDSLLLMDRPLHGSQVNNLASSSIDQDYSQSPVYTLCNPTVTGQSNEIEHTPNPCTGMLTTLQGVPRRSATDTSSNVALAPISSNRTSPWRPARPLQPKSDTTRISSSNAYPKYRNRTTISGSRGLANCARKTDRLSSVSRSVYDSNVDNELAMGCQSPCNIVSLTPVTERGALTVELSWSDLAKSCPNNVTSSRTQTQTKPTKRRVVARFDGRVSRPATTASIDTSVPRSLVAESSSEGSVHQKVDRRLEPLFEDTSGNVTDGVDSNIRYVV